jgi:hypothetical protein
MESIIAAAVTGVVTLVGVLVSSSRSRTVTEVRIDQLSSRMEKHNQMIERAYALDARRKVTESELSGLSKQAEKGERGMTRFLTGNEWDWRLLRTIAQGVLGVFVANIDMIIRTAVLGPAMRALVVLS